MGNLGSLKESETAPAGGKNLVVSQHPAPPLGEVIDIDSRPDNAADGLSMGRQCQPFVQRAALVGFEMAEADPADARGLHNSCHCLAHQREHLLHAGMVEECFVVNDKELIELEIILGDVGRNPIQVSAISSIRVFIGNLLRYSGTGPLNTMKVKHKKRPLLIVKKHISFFYAPDNYMLQDTGNIQSC